MGIAGLGAATGAFDVPEMEPIEDMYGGITGMDLIRQNLDKYSVGVPLIPAGGRNGGDILPQKQPFMAPALKLPTTSAMLSVASLSDRQSRAWRRKRQS